MVPLTAFAAGGWWSGLSAASVLIAAPSALAVPVGYLRVAGRTVETIEKTVVDTIAPGAGDVAGPLSATATAASGLDAELDALPHSETGRRVP